MKKHLSIGTVTAVILATLALPVLHTRAATSTEVVSPIDMGIWYFADETPPNPFAIPGPYGTMVSGPSTPPAGDGSAQITVDTPTERLVLATNALGNVPLSSITDLSFSTYQPSSNVGPSDYAIYLYFFVSFTGADNWQRSLAYVPRQNGTVLQDTWQTWDAINGGNGLWWWSGFASNGNTWPDGSTTEYRTWSDLVASFPFIKMNGGIPGLFFRAGEPYADPFTGNVDNFTFGHNGNVTTYDFEPTAQESVGFCNSTDPDLIAYWNLDEGAGATAEDVSANSNDGTLFNTPTWSSLTAPTSFNNPANVLFDGVDDYIDPGTNVGSFDLSDPFSISVWINPSLNSTDQVIFGNAWSSPGFELRMNTSNRARFILVENGSVYKGVDSSVLSAGWHHITGTWDGTDIKMFVDGVENSAVSVTNGTVTTITTAASTQIGRTPEGGNEKYFYGYIDDVRVYQRALSSSDISLLAAGNCETLGGSSSSSSSESSESSSESSSSSSSSESSVSSESSASSSSSSSSESSTSSTSSTSSSSSSESSSSSSVVSSSSSTSSVSSSSSSAGPITCDGQIATILGTANSEVINGTSGPDVIHGLGGNDIINGLNGDDIICGGDGTDILNGGNGEDTLFGNAEKDTLNGNNGDDVLSGGGDDDIVNGGNGNDLVQGNAGNDSMNGGRGNDTLDGGGGTDSCNDSQGSNTFIACEA